MVRNLQPTIIASSCWALTVTTNGIFGYSPVCMLEIPVVVNNWLLLCTLIPSCDHVVFDFHQYQLRWSVSLLLLRLVVPPRLSGVRSLPVPLLRGIRQPLPHPADLRQGEHAVRQLHSLVHMFHELGHLLRSAGRHQRRPQHSEPG